jgi:enoyl-CoA hydratase/carnithine racemase
MADDILLCQTEGPVTLLTLNAPASINALSTAMLTRLHEALAAIATSPARVVVLRAAGRNFCAGHDLRELLALRHAPDQGEAGLAALFALCAKVMVQLAALPQPVVAQVQGVATAAGCQLAASCDMVVAAEDARFGVNGVNIGLFCHTPLIALQRKIPAATAFALACTGEFIAAPRAEALGLVTRLATPDALQAEAMALATTLAQKLPLALAMAKQARPAADYREATRAMVANLMMPETAEGIAAFLEKRQPNWT